MDNNNFNDSFRNDGNQNQNNQNQSYNNQNYNNRGSNNIRPYSNKNSIFFKIFLPVFLSFLMLVLGFGLGFVVKMFTLTEEERLAKWVMETIKNEYLFYDDLTEEEKRFILENMGRGAAYATDRYGDFLVPLTLDEMNQQREGNFVDFGFDYGQAKDNNGNTFTFISQIYGNSDASKKGLQKYDRFFSLEYCTDSDNTKYISTGVAGAVKHTVYFEKEVKYPNEIEFTTEYSSISDIYTAIENIPAGVTINLSVKRMILDESTPNYLDYEIKTFIIEKKSYKPSFVEYKPIEGDTAIVSLMSFSAINIVDQVDEAMSKFKADGKKNLILDLRGNRGGYVDVFAEIASYFVTDSKISNKIFVGYAKNRNGERTGEYYTAGNKYNNAIEKLVILFDGSSASASEALIGAILDNDYRGIVKTVGTQSYGKGIYQSQIINTSLGYGLYLTCGYMYWPSGRCIDRSVANPAGVKPLKEVGNAYFNNGTDKGKDNQLQAAIDYMKGLIQIS